MQTMMTREQLVDRVTRLAAEQAGMDPAQVTLDMDLFNDLNYDSLDAVEFTMTLEDEFDLTIPDEEAEHIHTVGQAVEHLAALVTFPPRS